MFKILTFLKKQWANDGFAALGLEITMWVGYTYGSIALVVIYKTWP